MVAGDVADADAGKRATFFVWNYWDPAGAWDHKPDGSLKHWVGVHPNGGYYAVDVDGIVAAYERGLVFNKADIERLIATNRDFMWNKQIRGANFQRIDGGKPDARWAIRRACFGRPSCPTTTTCEKSLRPTTTRRVGAGFPRRPGTSPDLAASTKVEPIELAGEHRN